MAFINLENGTLLADVLSDSEYRNKKSIIFIRPVQSGKTADCLRVAEAFYKESTVIFVSDKNSALAEQTNGRARTMGFEVINYREGNLGKTLRMAQGKKKIVHFMMEVNNMQSLYDYLDFCEDFQVTMIVDEADKSRSTSEADIDEDEETGIADSLPPITGLLLKIKNLLKTRENSRTVFVSATPMGLFTSEKEDWLTIYKNPYQNYTGVGLDHPANLYLLPKIAHMSGACKTSDRWTKNADDFRFNPFYSPLQYGIEKFSKVGTKDDSIKQLMLVSLENRNTQQSMMAEFVREELKDDSIDVIVFNSRSRKKDETLADMIAKSNKKKIVIIAGFMAARGVSFTDFSDSNNKFELVLQVHYTKDITPLNSSLQAMRCFGPARRTVSKPALICNQVCEQDINTNFLEVYRIIMDLAKGNIPVPRGSYDSSRPMTQNYNFRYLKQGRMDQALLFVSHDSNDHLPIV